MIKIAIVEDNNEDAEKLKGYLERFCKEQTIEFDLDMFTNGLEFLDGIKGEFDVVIFDIEMPKLDGMNAAKRLRKLGSECCILFVTNMAQYAIQGYEVEAKGYMVKPVVYPNFAEEMKRITRALKMRSLENENIVINTKQGTNIINFASLIYIEVVGHNLVFHTENGDFIFVRKPMREIEKELTSDFARCSNCYIINFKYVRSINGSAVTLLDGTVLFMSRGKKEEFIKKFIEYTRR